MLLYVLTALSKRGMARGRGGPIWMKGSSVLLGGILAGVAQRTRRPRPVVHWCHGGRQAV